MGVWMLLKGDDESAEKYFKMLLIPDLMPPKEFVGISGKEVGCY